MLAVISFTRFGRAWRAVSDDPLAARFMGIDPARILAISAMLSSGLAGTAGIAILFAYGNASHSMGLMLSIKAMVAALIGGMGSPGGAVLGALVLVAVETFWAVQFGGTYRDIAVFGIMIGLLTLRPGGLSGAMRN
jgi:branched-chain amino acid transport system permease protein